MICRSWELTSLYIIYMYVHSGLRIQCTNIREAMLACMHEAWFVCMSMLTSLIVVHEHRHELFSIAREL